MSSPSGERDLVVAQPSTAPRPTRRTLLRATGLLGAAGFLAACGDDDNGSEDNANGGSTQGGTVRVWTVPTGPSDEEFQRAQFEHFQQQNSDIEVELQFFPADAYGNAMQLAFSGGGEEPDVFRQMGGGLLLRDLQRRGWIQPLTEFLTSDFTGRFPEWVYDEASSPLYVGGEAYAVPRPDPAVQAIRPLLYNIDILERFGFDAPPATWSEMREMAAKITTDGDRDVYGTAVFNAQSFLVMQRMAGPQPYRNDNEPPISLLTGEPAMSEPSMIDMIEFLQGMHQDEIFTPGWESWDPTQAIQQMAQGRLGFYLYPLHHAAEIRKANPEINLGFAPPPVPDSGRAGSLRPVTENMGFWFMSSEARNTEAAWRVLDFFGSEEFQRAAFVEEQQISIMPSVYDGIEVDDDTQRFMEIADEIVRTHPDPFMRDPKTEEFYNELKEQAPLPLPAERYVEAIARGSDFTGSAAEYGDQLGAVIEGLLGSSGTIDSMDAFVFPDWDPLEDYQA